MKWNITSGEVEFLECQVAILNNQSSGAFLNVRSGSVLCYFHQQLDKKTTFFWQAILAENLLGSDLT